MLVLPSVPTTAESVSLLIAICSYIASWRMVAFGHVPPSPIAVCVKLDNWRGAGGGGGDLE